MKTNTNDPSVLDPGVFARYQQLMPDWQAFCHTIEQPLPTTFWRNPFRASHQQLMNFFAQYDLKPQVYSFSPLAYQLPANLPISRLPAWQAGWFHVQEMVSMLAAPLLAPQAGQQVLDLCAAPGGKTAMLACLMQQQGLLLANDLSIDRIKALRHVIGRLGMSNVLCTQSDARYFQAPEQSFDAILADVPCSCEGTVRRNPKVRFAQPPRDKIQASQQIILAKAIELLKPGGRLLYSTCTLAPEENEAVVSQALSQHDNLSLVPIALEGIHTRPGLLHWQQQGFHPSMALSARLYPQDNNSGGFYLALMEKAA